VQVIEGVYTPKDIKPETPGEKSGTDVGNWVSMRGIAAPTMEKFGVKTYQDRQEYVYPSGGIKVRNLQEKGFYAKNGFKGDELFGMNLFPAGSAKKVTVTEGELDALSVYQMMDHRYINPVVSLPSATPSKKLWEKCSEWLNSFDQIVISVDKDEAGDAVASRMAKMFPNKVYRVDHGSYKDANDFLQAGKAKEFMSAWWGAQKYVPENVLNTSEQFLSLYRDTPEHQYVETGIQGLDDKILGLMQGHFTVIKAPTGIGKSLAPHTLVMRYDGGIVRADQVSVGDQLMGPDGNPRNVLNVNFQQGPMYRVTPVKGEPFECNADHILSLRHTSTGEIKNVVLTEYMGWSKTQKHLWKLWRTGVDFCVERFGAQSWKPAYIHGCYLGDGHKHDPAFSMGKKKMKVMERLYEFGVKPTSVTFDRGCYRIGFSRDSDVWRSVASYLEPRRIDHQYKVGTRKVRLYVLAGLLDTDGSVTSGGAEITQKSEKLADDICFVARSLGMAAYKKLKVVKGEKYYRVTISGDLTEIPCVRLKFKPRKQIKNVLNTGFTVEPIGEGTYRGIMLDGDHLFLLGDFTVTHNTEVMRYLEYNMIQKGVPIAAWHLEETKLRSLLGLVSYHLKDNVTRRDLIDEKGVGDLVIEAIKDLTKDELFYQFYLSDGQGADELIDQIRFFSQACGCKFVFFEPIQDVVAGTSEESKEAMLADLSIRLSKLAAELNVGIVTIAHTNENGDMKYCKMIGQRASVIISLSRDKESDDFEERNTTYLRVEKNRPCSEEGSAGRMRFNSETFTLKEVV
jgi:replicative DNA helicase/5S rRNA maturation endonuclease (ribonuclease M5)